jgi:hypothetical protein
LLRRDPISFTPTQRQIPPALRAFIDQVRV